jgi:aryl-alcohol dehydrogenase-like predicted oxidoreductase
VHDIIDVMRTVASAHNVSPADIALAFLLHNQATTSVIFGSTSPEQVKANLRASGLTLGEEEIKRLEDASALSVRYGDGSAGFRAARQQYFQPSGR